MPKDDYEVIVFKILLYLYGVFKKEYLFQKEVFLKLIDADDLKEGYLESVIRMMANDELISGTKFLKAWGNEYVMTSELSEMEITSKGIAYLKDNKSMQRVKKFFLENVVAIAGLIVTVLK